LKITYLGTSHGVPSADRFTTSFLLETQGRSYLIDAGAPVAKLLVEKNVEVASVKALFNTHFHPDHIFGGLEFISLCNWYYKESDIDIFLPEDSGVVAVKNLITATDMKLDSERIRLHSYDETFVYDDGCIKLTAFLNEHLKAVCRPSYSFCVESEGKTVFFSGDLSASLDDLPKILYQQHFDYVVVECAHFPAELLKEKLQGVNCDTLAVTHIYPYEKFSQIQKFSEVFNFEIIIPSDGEVSVI